MSNPLSIQVKACKKLVGIALAFINFHDSVGGSDKMKEMNSVVRDISQSTRIIIDSDKHSHKLASDILLGCLLAMTVWLIFAVVILAI